MRGKLTNGVLTTLDYHEELKRINESYNAAKTREGVTDDVMSAILRKPVKKYTDAECIKVAQRKAIDDEYKAKLKALEEYREIVTIPFTGQIPEGYSTLHQFRENGNVIEDYCVLAKDVAGIKQRIASVKQRLSSSDYKVIKTYEARLIGAAEPYNNIAAIIQERQALRDEYKRLEKLLDE